MTAGFRGPFFSFGASGKEGVPEAQVPSGYRRLMMHLALTEAFDAMQKKREAQQRVELAVSSEARVLEPKPVKPPVKTRSRKKKASPPPLPVPAVDTAWAARFALWVSEQAMAVPRILASLAPLPPLPEVKEPDDDGLVWLLYAAAAA